MPRWTVVSAAPTERVAPVFCAVVEEDAEFTLEGNILTGNCISIHAEANALLHSDYSARKTGTTLYVNGIPCFSCAKLAVNGGVRRLVAVDDPSYRDWQNYRPMLDASGVEIVLLDPKLFLDTKAGLGEDDGLHPDPRACPFGELI